MSGIMAPQQWIQRMDGNGIPFWVNHQTGMSTYIMPTMHTSGVIPGSPGMYAMANQGPHGMPGQGMPGQGMPGQGMPGQGMPGQGMPGQGMPGQGMQGGIGQGMGVVPGMPGVGGIPAAPVAAMGLYPPPGVMDTPYAMAADRPGTWKKRYDDDGGKYWVHSVTGEVLNRNPFVIPANDYGIWERKYDGDGGKFWMNNATGEVSREDPYM